MTGRHKHRAVSICLTSESVTGFVVLIVGLGLDDLDPTNLVINAADNLAAQKPSCSLLGWQINPVKIVCNEFVHLDIISHQRPHNLPDFLQITLRAVGLTVTSYFYEIFYHYSYCLQ